MPAEPSGWRHASFRTQLKNSLAQHDDYAARNRLIRASMAQSPGATTEVVTPPATPNDEEKPTRPTSNRLSATQMTHVLGDVQKTLCVCKEEDEEDLKEEETEKEEEIVYDVKKFDEDFDSRFAPEEMRCLALVAHNHMKPAMKDFVLSNTNLLRKFRLTGTGTTMKMLAEVFGEEHMDKYGGPVCKSGPLGGDAELVAQMCAENIGAVIFFQDPMDAHPHGPDIDCLNRQANVHNVVTCPNTSSAHAFTFALRLALKTGDASMIPSFFYTLESPSVAEYSRRQAAVLEAAKKTTKKAEKRLQV